MACLSGEPQHEGDEGAELLSWQTLSLQGLDVALQPGARPKVSLRETALDGAVFDPQSRVGEVSVRFVGELIAAHRDAEGNVVDGDPKAARKQRDVWTFARRMGDPDPNWQLVATA